jgi:hypothetical protein
MKLAMMMLLAACSATAHEGRTTRAIYEMPEPSSFLELAATGVLVFAARSFLESKNKGRAKANDNRI